MKNLLPNQPATHRALSGGARVHRALLGGVSLRIIGASLFVLTAFAPVAARAQSVSARAPQGDTAPGFTSARALQIVGAKSRAVVRALQNNDTKTLARFVHPTRGVKFSPYIAVEKSDRTISRAQMPYLSNHGRVWNWGSYDGSGDEMKLTWNGFRQEMLVPHAYLPLSSSGAREDFNLLSQNGNVPNTLLDEYPGAIYTRYYLAGTDPKFGGLDWRALFLAWRPVGKTWYLVGVANDQWTT